MIDLLKYWRKPTPEERLQSLVDATRDSYAVTEYRIRRAAAKAGWKRRKQSKIFGETA